MATGLVPGSGVSVWCKNAVMSPIANASGWPGRVRSAATSTRPLRSSGTPSVAVMSARAHARSPQHGIGGNVLIADRHAGLVDAAHALGDPDLGAQAH